MYYVVVCSEIARKEERLDLEKREESLNEPIAEPGHSSLPNTQEILHGEDEKMRTVVSVNV